MLLQTITKLSMGDKPITLITAGKQSICMQACLEQLQRIHHLLSQVNRKKTALFLSYLLENDMLYGF